MDIDLEVRTEDELLVYELLDSDRAAVGDTVELQEDLSVTFEGRPIAKSIEGQILRFTIELGPDIAAGIAAALIHDWISSKQEEDSDITIRMEKRTIDLEENEIREQITEIIK